jgi:hypothetical protein
MSNSQPNQPSPDELESLRRFLAPDEQARKGELAEWRARRAALESLAATGRLELLRRSLRDLALFLVGVVPLFAVGVVAFIAAFVSASPSRPPRWAPRRHSASRSSMPYGWRP